MLDFEAWKNPFRGMLIKHMERNYLLTDPVVVKNGVRWETRHRSDNNTCEQVQVSDTFCYIPIEGSLRVILQHTQSLDLMVSGCAAQFSTGDDELVYSDWCDGENGTTLREYFNTNYGQSPGNIPVFIQIYYDDVETTNPLGSKVGIHKIGAFYFVIKNFPPAVNSSLHNIHLLALTHAADLKKYGFAPVLNTLVKELIKLEKQGLEVVVQGKKYTFRCFLSQIVGDNLGIHALFGYMQNFSKATHACDLCMATQDNMQSEFTEGNLRTPALYEQYAADLAAGKVSKSDCGINEPCTSFDGLKYYHLARNDSSDVMHDLLEGVIPLEVKLLLNHIVYKLCALSLAELNRRIRSFDYGSSRSSKPSSITEVRLKSLDSSLGQRSAQMQTSFLHLPFIIADVLHLLPHQNWHLYLLLRQIVDIVFAPSIWTSELHFLQSLIVEHHSLFLLVYPDRRFIYKHHRMIHYPTLIRRSGPLLRMMVMRFEAKHNFFKRLSAIICNFQNITLSLARRHQMAHCFKWNSLPPLKGSIEVGSGKMPSLCDFQYRHLIPLTAGGVDIFLASRVSAFGQEYKPGDTLLWKLEKEMPVFVCVKQIVVWSENIWLITSTWFVLGYSEIQHCYDCVLQNETDGCVELHKILDYKPFPTVFCLNPECAARHIILRHKLCSDTLPSCKCVCFVCLCL